MIGRSGPRKGAPGACAAEVSRQRNLRRARKGALALLIGVVCAAWVSLPAAAEPEVRRSSTAAREATGRQSPESVADGVFSSAQATRGEQTFRQVCAACHDTGEFSGGRFRLTWVGQSAGDLFDTIATLMPEGDPGSLRPAEYAAVVAYLLQLNGYPAGEAELPTSLRELRGMEIVEAP